MVRISSRFIAIPQFAVYSVSREGYGFNNEPIKVTNFEVFKVKQLPVCEHMKQYDACKDFDEYEPYPADDAFSSWAWSCSNKDSLKRVLKEQFGVSQLPF